MEVIYECQSTLRINSAPMATGFIDDVLGLMVSLPPGGPVLASHPTTLPSKYRPHELIPSMSLGSPHVNKIFYS